MAKQVTKKVKILAHRGNVEVKTSGVQTSEGDKFHGEVVELPENEADLLIAMKRAEEVKAKVA